MANSTLADVCLNYGSVPVKIDLTKKEKILKRMKKIDDAMTKIIDKGLYTNEVKAFESVKAEKLFLLRRCKEMDLESRYARLDTSFLSMRNTLDYEGEKMIVPRFTVHPYKDSGNVRAFVDFKIDYFDSDRGVSVSFNSPNGLPEIFEKGLLKTVEGFSEAEFFEARRSYQLSLDKKLRKKYGNMLVPGHVSRLTAGFLGLMPVEVKKQIDEAKPFFDTELYLIKETNPDEWNASVVSIDPLVVGLFNEQAYLITRFDTTPIEEYVAREFSE